MRQHILEQAEAISEDKSLTPDEMNDKFDALCMTEEEEQHIAAWIVNKLEEMEKRIEASDKECDEIRADILMLENEIEVKEKELKKLLEERKNERSGDDKKH